MPLNPVDITGKKILITGATSQVGEPVVASWSSKADVYGLARFNNDQDKRRIEALGATTLKVDLADPDGLHSVPQDFDYVLNFAVVKTGDFEYDLAANAEGLGRLMAHCRTAKAFLHLSSTAVVPWM